jgi:hypothetical protein
MLPKMSFDRGAIKAGLQRMWQASHRALTTEQAHASGSIMMKMHRTYGDETMRDGLRSSDPALAARRPPGEETRIAQRPLREGERKKPDPRVCPAKLG